MDIAGIYSNQATHGTGSGSVAATASANRAPSPAASAANGADTVTLSDQGRELARAMGSDAAPEETPGKTTEDYPLEAYRIPGWYIDLTGGYTMLSGGIGSSWEECRTGYDRLSNADKDLYDEYSGILKGYYDQERAAAGISNDTGDYWRNFLQKPEVQDRVRQAVVDRLAADPRATELMRRFGIIGHPR